MKYIVWLYRWLHDSERRRSRTRYAVSTFIWRAESRDESIKRVLQSEIYISKKKKTSTA